jgi:hypothetical protein
MEREILSIPIYRCSPQEHEEEMNEEKRKLLEFCKADSGTEAYSIIGNSFDREKWYPWRYNEIVGWVQFILNNSKLSGELWFARKRISRTLKNKRFYYQGKVFECFLQHYNDNAEIAKHVFKSFKAWRLNSTTLKKRYIDLAEVESKVTTVQWLMIIGV